MVSEQNSKFAPAGFGLGEGVAGKIPYNDVNNIKESGWYVVAPSYVNSFGYYGVIRADVYDGDNIILHFYSAGGAYSAKRVKGYGTWHEWEWVNPPMQLGVEYVTTERFSGKSIYAQWIDFGRLPNTETKSVAHRISNASIIDISGIVFDDSGTNPITCISGVSDVWTNDSLLSVKTTTDLSTKNAYIYLKYTKD